MSDKLPEFTDDLAHCDPCGYPDADTTYVSASLMPGDLDRTINPFGGRWPVFAFLKRTCLRCGFQWAEAPLPPQQPAPELCDVRAVSGYRCKMPAGHFDIGDPHLFEPPQPEQCGDRSAGGSPCNLQAGHLSPHTSPHPCPAPAALGMKCSLPAGHHSPHQWNMTFS